MVDRRIFTSESVTEGHPDKVCDQISDAIVDAALADDPSSRVAVETLIKNDLVVLAGEVTTRADIDFEGVAKRTLNRIGYDRDYRFVLEISEQSLDISQGVTKGSGLHVEQGAGDQGMMFGYANFDTASFMPAPIWTAQNLTERLTDVRKSGLLPWLRPDGKSQVSWEYPKDENSDPRIVKVVLSAHHDEGVSNEEIYQGLRSEVLEVVCGFSLDSGTEILINPTGRFVNGGPDADAGLTGRKIIVDTYGGMGRHGGGAFSGKDPTKVDRSAAYMARHIAKNIVASRIADECEIQLAYAIGVAEPVSVNLNFFGTGKLSERKVEEIVRGEFPLTPEGFIEYLDLRKPIYEQTARNGHFGRNNLEVSWEEINKVDDLKKSLS